MSLELLKNIIYLDSKYNFVFTNFDYSFTSTSLFGPKAIDEDLYSSSLFLSPYYLAEIGLSIKVEAKTWEIEIVKKRRSSLPIPNSYEAKKGINPTDRDIEEDFISTLRNFSQVEFFREPTLPEVLECVENNLKIIFKKYDVPYMKGEITDKIMEQINTTFDLKKSEVSSLIFDDKEKGVFYKKMKNTLVKKDLHIKAKKI